LSLSFVSSQVLSAVEADSPPEWHTELKNVVKTMIITHHCCPALANHQNLRATRRVLVTLQRLHWCMKPQDRCKTPTALQWYNCLQQPQARRKVHV